MQRPGREAQSRTWTTQIRRAWWFAGLVTAAIGCAPGEGDRVDFRHGLPTEVLTVYTDLGPAAPTLGLRALVGFPIRDGQALVDLIDAIADPGDPAYGQRLTPADWIERFAPGLDDFEKVREWLVQAGFVVPFTATNRLLLEFTGTVGDFNQIFGTELHRFQKNDGFETYATLDKRLHAPRFVADRITGVILADPPADTSPLPGEIGEIVNAPPADTESSLTPAEIGQVYELAGLHQAGHRGQGVSLGVVAGATFKFKDVQSFWQSFGLVRDDPRIVQVTEPPATRYTETTLDVEWAGAMAPEAELIVYQGHDAHDTALLFTFNEAVGQGEVQVLTDSFAHREDIESVLVRQHYDAAARMAAALGITVVSASGDSAEPDIPCASPYVTCVGGTALTLATTGEIVSEEAWSHSGSGDSLSFPAPAWQAPLAASGKRATADLAINAARSYWVYVYRDWALYIGTSFSAPIFAGMIAVMDGERRARGKPVLGYLNPVLYTRPEVQAAFRDITTGATEFFPAGAGWDYPTGWGAPRAAALAEVWP